MIVERALNTLAYQQSIERRWHELGYSSLKYFVPIKPREGEQPRYWQNNVTHVGPDNYAVDIVTPDPRKYSLPIISSSDGVIAAVITDSTIGGNNPIYANHANYITVQTGIREFFKVIHLATNSTNLVPGDKVVAGQVIGCTGVSGYMMDRRHLHFMVGRWLDTRRVEYESLRIRLKDFPNPNYNELLQ